MPTGLAIVRGRRFDPPEPAVTRCVAHALEEDLLPLGDPSTSLIPVSLLALAVLAPREPGILAGTRCAEAAFAAIDPNIQIAWFADDGDTVDAGDRIAEVSGPARSLLTSERTVLNFLCHLSGIATLTRAFVSKAHGVTRIRDSRKTTPGLRALEKAAVRAGGGSNHRGTLSEAILIKDNHLTMVDIRSAIAGARELWPDHKVQIECDSLTQVEDAVRGGADSVLLDNMSPEVARQAVELAGERLFVEASGGITLDSVEAFVAAGVDSVAIGALTHSAPALDIGMDFVYGS